MKKVLFLAVAFIMATTTIQAQEGYEDTKHEVAVSLGGFSNSQWIDVFEDAFVSIVGVKYDNEKHFGPVSAEYFYHTNKWLGVGGIFVYGNRTQDGHLQSQTFEEKASYYTLMPAVKMDWLRKKNWGMYSKFGIGATLRSDSADGKSDSAIHVNWQASLLGIEAGSPYIRGFLELGTGEQGLALIGLRYKF